MSTSSDSGFFLFEVEGVSSALGVVRFHGSEGMSQLYEFHVELACEDPDLAFEDILGKPALLTILTNDDPRCVHGIVSRFEQTSIGPKKTLYVATVVPRLWTLGLRQDCCIFQEKSVPDILKQVLDEAGLADGEDYEFKLNGDYETREYVVQYRETDMEFMARLMEEEGIYYFFEHTDAGHKLVLSDHTGAYAEISGDSTVVFREGDTGMQADIEEIRSVRYSTAMRPGKVLLTDWNFKKVDLDLAQPMEASAESALEIYDYPGRYHDTSVGQMRSTVRIEALRAERSLLTGESNVRRLTTGHKFTMAEHLRDDLNQEYLVVRLRHSGSQLQAAGADGGGGGDEEEEMYENTFEAIPSGVIFRAPQMTPRARVEGPQTAIVTGPSGEEIYCDEHGRVKVQFHWDRIGQGDDKTSCWVRCSQAWSGSGYGGMVIPRIGNEVIVSFLEGDPDRPLITGHVYNGGAMYGYSLPADKTRTSIRSNSSPGGGGFNELRFEDAAGNEEVFLHAQKDWNIKVLNNRTQEIGNDHEHKVGHDETMEVKNDRKRKVGANESIDVVGNETIKIGGDLAETVGGTLQLTVSGAQTIKVTGAVTNTFEAAQTSTVGADDSHSVSGNSALSVTGNHSASIDGNLNETVKGDRSLAVSGADDNSVSGDHKLDVKGAISIESGSDIKIKAGSSILIECGSSKIKMDSGGKITIEGSEVSVKSSGNVQIKGSALASN